MPFNFNNFKYLVKTFEKLEFALMWNKILVLLKLIFAKHSLHITSEAEIKLVMVKISLVLLFI